jgi:hypothetical protein
LDSKIRELSYNGGRRFSDEKRCLAGTREDFLEHVVNWIENPESKRWLVLLGRAGTGKSTIANEITCHFDSKYLGSYFAFRRKEDSRDDAYQLFTTLARDHSDRHRTFNESLGGSLRIIRLFVLAGTILPFSNASSLNRSGVYNSVIQSLSSSMPWMRVEMQLAQADYTPFLPTKISRARHLKARGWYRTCVRQSIICRYTLHG